MAPTRVERPTPLTTPVGACLRFLALFCVLAILTPTPALGGSGGAEAWLWTRHGIPTPQAISLLAELQSAESYGLRADDYARDLTLEFASELAGGLSHAVAQPQFDTALSNAVSHFLRDLHFGRVEPKSAGFDLAVPRPK